MSLLAWGHRGQVFSLESHKQIAVVLNTAQPPPSAPSAPPPPPGKQPPTRVPPVLLLLRPALISRHFESFSHCIFYHFFLRLALSFASVPFKIQSQKTRQLASWILSLRLCLSSSPSAASHCEQWLLERAHLTEEFHTVLEKCIFSHL